MKIFELNQIFMHNFLSGYLDIRIIYCQIIYCLQEKSKHFSLELSIVYKVSAHFEPKSLEKGHKFFELYQVFMCNLLCEVVPRLTKRIDTF